MTIRTIFRNEAMRLAIFFAALAGLFRLFWLPTGDFPLQSDELGYLADGVQVAEGILPSYSFAPAAWPILPVALYSLAKVVWHVIEAVAGGGNLAVNALLAADAAFFDIHAHMTGLRLAIGIAGIAIALAGTWSASIFGHRLAGVWGAILCGGLSAVLPLFVEYALQARPYAAAWSFIAMAALAATSANPTVRNQGAGALLGVAIACRLDAAIAIPFLLLVHAWQHDHRPAREIVATLAGVIVAFLVVAPWYGLALLSNLRTLITVRVLNAPGSDSSILDAFFFDGLFGPIFLIGLALAMDARRRLLWWLACALYLVVLALLLLKPSAFGLRHQGSIVTVLVLLAPLALQVLRQRLLNRAAKTILGIFLGIALLVPAIVAISRTLGQLEQRRPEAVTVWLEANVPAETPVFVPTLLRTPLPTEASARRLWEEVASADAWRYKLQQSGGRLGLSDATLPRAFSDRHIALDRSSRRRLFILGGDVTSPRPRYDLHVVSGGGVFDLTPAQAIAALCAKGGILVMEGIPPKELGKPTQSWSGLDGRTALHVFRRAAGECSP